MPAPLNDNNVSAYVHRLLDDLVGEPDFGSSWDGGKQIVVDAVAPAMRSVVSAAGGGASTVSGARLENALWKAHDVIVGEDKSWGFHASTHSVWRTFGMGGDGILQSKEQGRAARKDAVASQLLAFINGDRADAEQSRLYGKAKDALQAGHADWTMMSGWSVFEGDDWFSVPEDSAYAHALSRAARELGRDLPPGA